jgi:2-O-methyltransferase
MLWSFLSKIARGLLAPRPRALPPVSDGNIEGDELVRLLGRADPVILDIGCNNGFHTNWFLELFAGSRVYAFEPDPRAAKAFRLAVQSARAKLFELAISDRDGQAEFHASGGLPDPALAERFPEGWHQSGSLRRPRAHLEEFPWCTFDRTFAVEVRRLDRWSEEEGVDAIDLIWADVQGAEGDLIAGGRRTLARTRFFYTEYDNREMYEGQISLEKLLSLLPDFEVVHRYRWDVLLRNRTLGEDPRESSRASVG